MPFDRPALVAVLAALALGCLVVATLCAILALAARRKGRRGAEWPTAKAKIIASWIRTESDGKGNRIHGAAVRYAYRVKGRDYPGERLDWGGIRFSRDRNAAAAVVGRYPAGSEVEVHYDPDQPATAVIEPISPGAGRGALAAATLLAAAALVLAAVFAALVSVSIGLD